MTPEERARAVAAALTLAEKLSIQVGIAIGRQYLRTRAKMPAAIDDSTCAALAASDVLAVVFSEGRDSWGDLGQALDDFETVQRMGS